MKHILEGKAIKSELDFHDALAIGLSLPRHYGKNLDALWDALMSDLERPLVLVWRDSEQSRLALADRFDEIIAMLRRVEQQDVANGLEETFKLRLE